MKLISLNEWMLSNIIACDNKMLESVDNEIIKNIFDMLTSPDPVTYELVKQLVVGQFSDDKFLLLKFQNLFKILDNVYSDLHIYYYGKLQLVDIEIRDSGDFMPVFSSVSNVRVGENMVKNGTLIYRFEKVGGNFDCHHIRLKNLSGCPREVGGNFNCNENLLKTLEGGPVSVGGNYICSFNKLINLKGVPDKIPGNFRCAVCGLKTLEGGPSEVGGDFNCTENKLKSLIGAPRSVGGNFFCGDNTTKFTKKDVWVVCEVQGEINCED